MLSHKSARLISFCRAQDPIFVVVTVYDLLQFCHFTADTSDVNTFIEMSWLSETTSGTVSEHTKFPDMYLRQMIH